MDRQVQEHVHSDNDTYGEDKEKKEQWMQKESELKAQIALEVELNYVNEKQQTFVQHQKQPAQLEQKAKEHQLAQRRRATRWSENVPRSSSWRRRSSKRSATRRSALRTADFKYKLEGEGKGEKWFCDVQTI